jgi:hypothetical protein
MTGLRETLDPKGEKRLGLTWSVLPLYQSSTLLVRTVRRGALDNFLLIGRSQIERILEEYVAFYNSQRPHQGNSATDPKAW